MNLIKNHVGVFGLLVINTLSVLIPKNWNSNLNSNITDFFLFPSLGTLGFSTCKTWFIQDFQICVTFSCIKIFQVNLTYVNASDRKAILTKFPFSILELIPYYHIRASLLDFYNFFWKKAVEETIILENLIWKN